MRRRGFILNSTILILLIPILLLLTTYEDVSSQIIQAQSERVQIERSFSSTAYFDIDFQRALEIAGKRAVIAAVDYVSVTGNFLNSTMANETIRELILFGNSTVLSGYENLQKIMRNQSLIRWLGLMREKLREQGFYLLPENDTLIINRTEIVIAPLDSFRVVVKAKIHNVTIVDTSGKVVYTGSIPKTTKYTYAIVDIRELEDPLFPPMTGGKYHRSIRACLYPFPELIERPIIALDGVGESNKKYIVGFYGQDILYNSTHIWKDTSSITNITLKGVPVSPVYSLNDWDRGILVFRNLEISPEIKWCNLFYDNRVNVTILNNADVNLTNFQVPIELDLSSNKISLPQTPNITIYDENCNPINFWVEEWTFSSQGANENINALIWVNVTIPANSEKVLGIYFDENAIENWGNASKVFDFYDDFEGTSFETSKWINTPVAGDNGQNTGTGSWTVENGLLKSDTSNKAYGLVSIQTFSAPIIIEAKMRNNPDNLDNDVIGVLFAFQDWDKFYGAIIDYGDTSWGASTSLVADQLDWQERFNDDTTRTTPMDGNWRVIKVEFYQAGHARYYLDDSLISDRYDTWYSYSSGSVGLVSGYMGGGAHFDWIRIRKYADPMPSVSVSTIETKPQTELELKLSNATAYDIQPFIDCIVDQRYFGVYNGWSLFERLEGSSENHEAYFNLSKQLQKELGLLKNGKYYPIGLLSFLLLDSDWDAKLVNTLNQLGVSFDNQTVVDYYFLQYHFANGDKIEGYKVRGIEGYVDNFYLDNETAVAIFGKQAACDLLEGYTCS